MIYVKQFFKFGFQQVLCCIFPAFIFLLLAVSKFMNLQGIPRYDFILYACILFQWLLVKTKLETVEEFKVIMLFHVIGLCLELYKVRMGSWAYPEDALFKIGGVPLYSGFMYASVASYIVQAWRRFSLKVTDWPISWLAWGLSLAIYLNFFTHHYWLDLRWELMGLLTLVFLKTRVYFTVNQVAYHMPMTLSFFLIGFFIWIAENISTFLGAWQYPNQEETWHLVHLGKISSWFLLVVISVIIVANLKLKDQNKANKKTSTV